MNKSIYEYKNIYGTIKKIENKKLIQENEENDDNDNEEDNTTNVNT